MINENISDNTRAQALNKTDVSGSTWFKTEQIETVVNVNGDMTAEQIKACRKKLIVLHECGEDKKALIEQLETMILGLKTNFDWFAS
jgi:hypothetical protein